MQFQLKKRYMMQARSAEGKAFITGSVCRKKDAREKETESCLHLDQFAAENEPDSPPDLGPFAPKCTRFLPIVPVFSLHRKTEIVLVFGQKH